MAQKYPLSKKERRGLAEEIRRHSSQLASAILSANEVVIIRTRVGKRKVTIYLIDMFPALVKENDIIFPTMYLVRRISWKPFVVVDKGAAERIAKGAHVMVPGIVKVSEDFEKGEVAVVYDEEEKPIAIGLALMSKEEIERSRRGKALRNLHYDKDKICKLMATLLA